eukprot:COSAG06_NODE_4495_length_4204_cov_1.487698_7_plen_135_part_00
MLNPARPTLWLGSYTPEVTGPRSASLTSAPCEATGAQLIRRFELAEIGSRLRVTQVIRNVSESSKQYFHWSRSFAHGGGRVLIPLSEGSRYPSKYMYEPILCLSSRGRLADWCCASLLLLLLLLCLCHPQHVRR